jgi:uncharacterized repeat protein (TIGR01451 family)
MASDTSNGTLALAADGSFDYTPSAGFNGSDSFTYQANDGTASSNIATVAIHVGPTADLSITKNDGQTEAVVGQPVIYTISVMNAGPSEVPGASVIDVFPTELTNCSWICTPTGGACTAGPVDGNINDTVDVFVGGHLTYTATCTVDPSATGTLSNTATVSTPSEVTDPNSSNDSATDADELIGLCGFPTRLTLENQTINTTEVFKSCGSITAGTNFRIISPGNVTFRAGQSIVLENGFSVEAGATLTAEIDPKLN